MKAIFCDGLLQDRSNSNALAVELLQSCIKPSRDLCHFSDQYFRLDFKESLLP